MGSIRAYRVSLSCRAAGAAGFVYRTYSVSTARGHYAASVAAECVAQAEGLETVAVLRID